VTRAGNGEASTRAGEAVAPQETFGPALGGPLRRSGDRLPMLNGFIGHGLRSNTRESSGTSVSPSPPGPAIRNPREPQRKNCAGFRSR
jgi:hypothetical protein